MCGGLLHRARGRTQSWLRDPYAYGEASALLPGQHTELLPSIPVAEGPLHFAGDQHVRRQTRVDLRERWSSAVRTALEIHTA